jgi:predicted transposase YbfD/YdcC
LNTGHGRIEKRTCCIITETDWICNKEDWEALNTLIEITSERTIKATGIKETQIRHYISNGAQTALKFNEAIRGHWGIENKLHWTLDVVFGEDGSTKRAGTAAENFSFMSKVALNCLINMKYKKGARVVSMKTKRKRAGWDNDFLLAILAKAG